MLLNIGTPPMDDDILMMIDMLYQADWSYVTQLYHYVCIQPQ